MVWLIGIICRQLAETYAKKHKLMSTAKNVKCDGDDDDFAKQGGVTNGAAWYSVAGGMQDFNYLGSNDFEVTLELGCQKYPPTSKLPEEWENNKLALLEYMWNVSCVTSRLFLFFAHSNNLFFIFILPTLVAHWHQGCSERSTIGAADRSSGH